MLSFYVYRKQYTTNTQNEKKEEKERKTLRGYFFIYVQNIVKEQSKVPTSSVL